MEPLSVTQIATEMQDVEQIRVRVASQPQVPPQSDQDSTAPRTPTEKKLAEIWAESLGLEQIGVHDDFFELGGHSILAMQVLSRARAVFKVELPLTVLFANDFTVAEIAKAIEQRQIEEAGADEIAGMLEELEGLSDEEVKALLDSEETGPG